MKNVSSGVLAVINSRKFWTANLFKFTLYDGTILRYTDCDQNLIWSGNTYSCGGPSQSGGPFFNNDSSTGNRAKAHWKIGTDVDTIQFDVIPGTGLVEGIPFLSAIRAGFFDQATCEIDRVFMSTFSTVVAGTVPIFLGYVSDIDVARSLATFTVNGGTVLLLRPYPFNLYQAGCLNTLYDTNCTLSRASFTKSGAATSGSTSNIINDTTLTDATSPYDLGMMKFTSGQNNGFLRGIQTYVHGSPNVFTLMSPFPFAPAPGDTFSASFGCNKVLNDTVRGCAAKSNQANFRGFPFVPQPQTAG